MAGLGDLAEGYVNYQYGQAVVGLLLIGAFVGLGVIAVIGLLVHKLVAIVMDVAGELFLYVSTNVESIAFGALIVLAAHFVSERE